MLITDQVATAPCTDPIQAWSPTFCGEANNLCNLWIAIDSAFAIEAVHLSDPGTANTTHQNRSPLLQTFRLERR